MAQNTTTLNHTKDIALSDSSRTRFFPMLNIVASNRFKKDLKLAAKCGFDLDLLESVVGHLIYQKGPHSQISRSRIKRK